MGYENNLNQPRYAFKKRVSRPPSELGLTFFLKGNIFCPDLWESETGDYLVIGRDVTKEVYGNLPSGASVGPDERVVLIPRSVLSSAKPDIPDAYQLGFPLKSE